MGKIAELIVQLGADSADLAQGLKKARTDIEKFQAGISGISNLMVGVGATGLAAAGGAVKAFGDWAAAVNDLEDKTNMSAESASKLLYVTQAVGLGMSDAGDALAKMSKNAETAAVQLQTANATGKASTDMFTRYGITITDTNGKLLSAEQILANVALRHRDMANGVEKTAMEMEIFGRSGAKLNDLLNLTEQQMADMAKRAEKSGLVLSHEVTQGWEDLTIQLREAKLSLQGLSVQIGQGLMPYVRQLINGATEAAEWVRNLDDVDKGLLITTIEVTGAVGGLGLGLRALLFTFGPLIEGIGNVIKAFQAMKIAAISARAAALGSLAVIGAAVAYGTAKKYEAYKESGAEAFTYEEGSDGVQIDTERVQADREARAKKEQEDLDLFDRRERSRKEAAQATEARKQADLINQMNTATGYGGTQLAGAGGGSGGQSAKAAKEKQEAERRKQEAERIQDSIKRVNESAVELGKNFENAGRQLSASMLEGAAAVYSEIEEEKNRRIDSLDAFMDRYRRSVEEAQKIKEDADKTQDAKTMERAEALLKERQEAELAAAEEIAARKIAIEEDMHATMLANSTRARAIQAELEAAYREGNLAQYQQALTDENVAFLSHLEEQQTMMQQYHDWRMEAEQSFQSLRLQMMEEFKTSFSEAMADAIVSGKNLEKALQNIATQMIQMYIKWRIQKALAGVFARKQQAQETATSSASAATLAAAWWAAAIPKMIVTGGFGGFGGFGGMGNLGSGMGSLSGGFTSFGGGLSNIVGGWNPLPMASGGIAYGPTFALIGEGKDMEAVFPLNDRSFGAIAEGIAGQGVSGNVIFHVSALDAGSFSEWLSATGGKVVRQYLYDSDREFAGTEGVW